MVISNRAISTTFFVLAVGTLVASCVYHDSFSDCRVSCDTVSGCPSGLTCGDEGLCRTGETTAACTAVLTDAGSDSKGSNVDAQKCFGSGNFTICLQTPPTSSLDIETDTTIATDSTVATGSAAACDLLIPQTGGPTLCVMARTSIIVAATATLSAIVAEGSGGGPLVLLATGDLTVSGTVDVASHLVAGTIGAGADSSLCSLPTGAGEPNGSGSGGGGAGGSFGTTGGAGGGENGVANGGKPGAAIASPPELLHGGCRGGWGGSHSVGPYDYGDGGGAVYLLAGGTISISGIVNASGDAGFADTSNGGGGGAGGMIALFAPTLNASASAKILANGGGGAGGGASTTGGGLGNDPNPMTPLTPAPGGFGASTPEADGGAGGSGAAGTMTATAGGSTPTYSGGYVGGGGGGGGGLGVIRVLSGQLITSTGAMVSPMPTD